MAKDNNIEVMIKCVTCGIIKDNISIEWLDHYAVEIDVMTPPAKVPHQVKLDSKNRPFKWSDKAQTIPITKWISRPLCGCPRGSGKENWIVMT
jgi:hypothetical protein